MSTSGLTVDTRIIEGAIEPAVGSNSLRDHRLNVGPLRHVHLHEGSEAARVLDHFYGLVAAIFLDVREQQFRALARKDL